MPFTAALETLEYTLHTARNHGSLCDLSQAQIRTLELVGKAWNIGKYSCLSKGLNPSSHSQTLASNRPHLRHLFKLFETTYSTLFTIIMTLHFVTQTTNTTKSVVSEQLWSKYWSEICKGSFYHTSPYIAHRRIAAGATMRHPAFWSCWNMLPSKLSTMKIVSESLSIMCSKPVSECVTRPPKHYNVPHI